VGALICEAKTIYLTTYGKKRRKAGTWKRSWKDKRGEERERERERVEESKREANGIGAKEEVGYSSQYNYRGATFDNGQISIEVK
jgi:hypothetical protein